MLRKRSRSVFPSRHSQPQPIENKPFAKSVTPFGLHSRASNNGRGFCFFIGLRGLRRPAQRADSPCTPTNQWSPPIEATAQRQLPAQPALTPGPSRTHTSPQPAKNIGQKCMLDAIIATEHGRRPCRRRRCRLRHNTLRTTSSQPSWEPVGVGPASAAALPRSFTERFVRSFSGCERFLQFTADRL